MRFSYAEFNRRFPTNEACLDELMRLQYTGKFCLGCGKTTRYYKLKTRPVYSCQWCGHQVSPMAGTIFAGTKADLRTWFLVMWLVATTKTGISSYQVERITGVSHKTAWRMLNRVRTLMAETGEVYAGEVETDETFFGPKPGRDSRVKKRTRETVVGVLDRASGRVVAHHVPSPNVEATRTLMEEHVEKGSVVHTDGARTYINALEGYEQRAVKHWSIEPLPKNVLPYFLPSADMGTQRIENFWGVMKRGFRGTYIHCSPKWMQSYVDEYCWRFSNRLSDVPLFELLLTKAGS